MTQIKSRWKRGGISAQILIFLLSLNARWIEKKTEISFSNETIKKILNTSESLMIAITSPTPPDVCSVQQKTIKSRWQVVMH